MKTILSDLNLNTICDQALCPNISECYKRGQATFLILGKTCTRNCGFCNVTKGIPSPPDPDEPDRIALAVKRLMLRHAVITSPTRDDLPDGGAGIFSNTVFALRKNNDTLTIEVLIPDFTGKLEHIIKAVKAAPDIIGHNLETVRRLYEIRKGADYKRSLNVLKIIKEFNPHIKTKSAIMLGIGETEQEVFEFFEDLLKAGCRYLSIGQYLAPTRGHHPVMEYVHPEKFTMYKQEALRRGFIHVESGPYVRSSYRARLYLRTEK